MKRIWAALIAATLIVAVVCIAIVFARGDDARSEDWPWRYDGPPIEDWPWRDDEFGPDLVVCHGGLFEAYVSNEYGCSALSDLRAERDRLRASAEQSNDLLADLSAYIASLPLTSCLERQRRYDTAYYISGKPHEGSANENLLRRECGNAEAARFIEATTRERPAWADPTPVPTPTPTPDACSGRDLSTADYVRCRCAESGNCR